MKSATIACLAAAALLAACSSNDSGANGGAGAGTPGYGPAGGPGGAGAGAGAGTGSATPGSEEDLVQSVGDRITSQPTVAPWTARPVPCWTSRPPGCSSIHRSMSGSPAIATNAGPKNTTSLSANGALTPIGIISWRTAWPQTGLKQLVMERHGRSIRPRPRKPGPRTATPSLG